MTAVGLYAPGSSWLYQADPRAKIWMALLGIILCLLCKTPWDLLVVLIICHLVLLAGEIPASTLIKQWRNLAPLLLVILILQPLIMPGNGAILARIGPIAITTTGLITGLHYALRVAGAAFFALIPILTTPIQTLVRGFQKMGLPYVWGMTIGLSLRYLGTIGELYKTISEAQQARGLDLSKGNLAARARAAIPTLIAVIIASLRLSDSLALGMAARGFGMKRARTWRHDITMQTMDWLVFTFSLVLFTLGVWWLISS